MRHLTKWAGLLVLLLLLIVTLASDSDPEAAPPSRPDGASAAPLPDEGPSPPSPEVAGPPPETVEAQSAEVEPQSPERRRRLEGQVPDELLGEGDATLTLRLVASATGETVATSIRLWRLAVPAGGGWIGGDQIQRLLDVPEGGVEVEDLPAGWYRVQANGQRKGAADPPRFFVPDGPSSQDVELTMPRTFRARLRVFDADGRELREAALASAPGGSSGRTKRSAPEWANPRRPEGPVAGISEGFRCRRALFPKPGVVRVDPEGFDLGEVRESARQESWSRVHRLTVPGSNEVRCKATGDDGGDATYYGVVVPEERLVANVRLPNGDPLPPHLLKIEARCYAKALPDDAPPGAWREVPIHVRVEFEGHEPLRFQWRLDQPALERHLTRAD